MKNDLKIRLVNKWITLVKAIDFTLLIKASKKQEKEMANIQTSTTRKKKKKGKIRKKREVQNPILVKIFTKLLIKFTIDNNDFTIITTVYYCLQAFQPVW